MAYVSEDETAQLVSDWKPKNAAELQHMGVAWYLVKKSSYYVQAVEFQFAVDGVQASHRAGLNYYVCLFVCLYFVRFAFNAFLSSSFCLNIVNICSALF